MRHSTLLACSLAFFLGMGTSYLIHPDSSNSEWADLNEARTLGSQEALSGTRETSDLLPIDQAPSEYREPIAKKKEQQPASPPGPQYVNVDELAKSLGDDWFTKEVEGTEASGPTAGELKHGEWVIRHPLYGNYETGNYMLGARHGKWKSFNADGVLMQEHTYFAGKRNGVTRFRSREDEPWMYATYRDDELVEEEY